MFIKPTMPFINGCWSYTLGLMLFKRDIAVGFIQVSDYSKNRFKPFGEMSRWLANAHANAEYHKAIEEPLLLLDLRFKKVLGKL